MLNINGKQQSSGSCKTYSQFEPESIHMVHKTPNQYKPVNGYVRQDIADIVCQCNLNLYHSPSLQANMIVHRTSICSGTTDKNCREAHQMYSSKEVWEMAGDADKQSTHPLKRTT